jgi:hypothetical protein
VSYFTGTGSATASQNATPEKGFSRDPPVLPNVNNKRDALSHINLNNPARPLGLNSIASTGRGLGMGLSRFVGKDKEDEAIRAEARRRLV